MRTLKVFNLMTLDGYIAGQGGDISWHNPVVLGKGKTMFEGVKNKIGLKLISTRTFRNKNVHLKYEPMK